MIPITKNILVVDESGNQYTPTFAKRAKGLVKQGRARWLDETTVCLACPPQNIEEDAQMDAIQNKTPDTVKTHETELTLAELLRRLDALHTERDMLEKTVAEIRAFPNQENPQKLHAAVEVYAAHERTLQRELAFLEHLYDDRFSAKAKSPRQQERERVIESLIQGAAQASSPDIATQMLRLVSELMAHA